jgi:hypothetical protein
MKLEAFVILLLLTLNQIRFRFIQMMAKTGNSPTK